MSSESLCNSCKTPLFRPSLLPQLTQTVQLQKRLRTNDYPSQSEAIHCAALVSASAGELERYDAEILRLRTSLDQIELDRAAVEDYTRLCRYILSPIRRLPAEILVQIFALCSTDPGGPLVLSTSVAEEIGRAAKAELMQLSQVCPRWHQLIMGSPVLWSDIALTLCWWSSLKASQMMDLLRRFLDRGINSPLEVRAHCARPICYHPGPLELLAQHSQQWKEASFAMNFSCLEVISAVRGNLPLLQRLDIYGGNPHMASDVTTFFDVAPRLTEVDFRGPAAALSHLPLEQLRSLRYFDVPPEELDRVLSLMTRLSGARSELFLRLDSGDDESEPHPPTTDYPVVTSDVWSLVLDSLGDFGTERANDILTHLLSHLTLPSLFALRFQQARINPLLWPHVVFSSLSQRSSFHSHLVCLDLHHVLITETGLVQTLSGLQSLQQLSIWDHKNIDDEGADHVLLTDSLLHRLNWSSDPTCLVPGLSYFGCHTLLQFDDTIYRDFVLSRLKPGRNERGPFEVEMEWYPGHRRELDPALRVLLDDLQLQGEFLFTIRPSDFFTEKDEEEG
ncbi:hypothetical protein DFH09DRAFT_1452512 [Mycena vulgaris]|nr:hypothetical protein DFH09DRAFT_1452512 [Mycena vulgaris]